MHHWLLDVLQGIGAASMAVAGVMYQDLYPVLSFTAVSCGAILGLHGVWRIFHGKYPGDH